VESPTCNCGATIPVPDGPNQQGDLKGDSLCECGQLWEFKFSPGGRLLDAPPMPVGPPAKP
jgi:hypothetical protein